MWRTPTGNRTLQGAEAALVRALVAQVIDDIDLDADLNDVWTYNVALFDDLTWQQKLALLARVALALLQPDVPSPPLNAINEAMVAVLFEALERAVRIEIDSEAEISVAHRTKWRRLILAAIGPDDDEEFPLPDALCPNYDDWDVLIEALSSSILWDDDWDMPGLVMDMSPEHARQIKCKLSIADDYYTGIAPDPTAAELVKVRQVLRHLTASPNR